MHWLMQLTFHECAGEKTWRKSLEKKESVAATIGNPKSACLHFYTAKT